MTSEEVAEIHHGNIFKNSTIILGLSWWLRSKEVACQCRRCGFCPWRRGNPLQSSCLGNPMDRGAWVTVHGVPRSQTQLSS